MSRPADAALPEEVRAWLAQHPPQALTAPPGADELGRWYDAAWDWRQCLTQAMCLPVLLAGENRG
ncbi:MAG: hypothetical protein AB1814_02840 [Thermodesulfobacteriota bacterium]